MFVKLLKWEFRQTGRVMLPVLGGSLILYGGALGVQALMGLLVNAPLWLNVACHLLYTLTVLALIMCAVAAFFYGVVRFYRLLGDEGYLMFSLPVTASQHIGAKLIASCAWTILSALFSFVASGAEAVTIVGTNDPELEELLAQLWPGAPLYLGFFAFLLVSLVLSVLWMYFLCAVGAQWGQSRFAATVIAYIVSGIAVQILSVAALAALAFAAAYSPLGQRAAVHFMTNPLAALTAWVWGFAALSAAFAAALFFATRYLVTKRLNLA